MNLQRQIEAFVNMYAPVAQSSRDLFIGRLRAIMNEYARSAIAHGDIPETGVAHRPQGERLRTAAGKEEKT